MAKSSNKSVVPEAREALNKFKMEAASDEDVQLPLKIKQNNNKLCVTFYLFRKVFVINL